MKFVLTISLMFLASGSSMGAKLLKFSPLDQDFLMLHIIDGEVKFIEEKKGTRFPKKFAMDKVLRYSPPLDVGKSSQTSSWRIRSTDDSRYKKGLEPLAIFRKSKVNGQSQQRWLEKDFHYEYTHEHFVYLKLPHSLKQGKRYWLSLDSSINVNKSSIDFTFDVFQVKSEAIHVNLVGYERESSKYAADLYHWLGDGGARDYASFVGNSIYLFNVKSGRKHPAGSVKFWKRSGLDVGGFNLTKSDVWILDSGTVLPPSTYRLVVEGVGSSQDFEVKNKLYREPFRVAVKGYYYMRIGEKIRPDITPHPRQPRYIPGRDPKNTRVYKTRLHSWMPEWKALAKSGDLWDAPEKWRAYMKKGSPTNPNAWGGHSDAWDWDRHLKHVLNIYDILLPYFLTNGALRDDNLGIAESGNGIPDVLDEARYEVDFWLRLRDGKGYSGGLTNPTKNNEIFQSAASGMAAWANAANAAMLAECFRIAKNYKLMRKYKEHAEEAYRYAMGLDTIWLDRVLVNMRGRDLKLMAAAFLFNVTGKKTYEKVIKDESIVRSPVADLAPSKSQNQLWATAAYLKSHRKISYPKLQNYMRSAIYQSAWNAEVSEAQTRPSRRSNRKGSGWFRTAQNVHLSMIAHATVRSKTKKARLLRAMTLEADYGLGRNPLNMIQMTTASSSLQGKRSVEAAYTSGGNDGFPGMHPGHTPFMNLFNWWNGMTGAMPTRLGVGAYPRSFKETWPHGEGFFNTRYVFAHSEFTPRQTMRGKFALYGYLYGIRNP